MELPRTRDERIAAVASLEQPLRRRLYALLADRDEWTTRDEAAAALNVARSVVAFHLDKLADAGVVEVGFERTSGRTGPGAGRPSKQYRLAADELSASMPDRHYDLAGQILADAVANSTASGAPVDECLQQAARERGRSMGLEVRAACGDADPTVDTQILAPLSRRGYEPSRLDDGEIALSNCPFHRLAEDHRSLVCRMNLDLLSGLVDALSPELSLHAELAPEPGFCCVRLRKN